jgi:DNA helicase TIP49 (TBP-interacting protein)
VNDPWHAIVLAVDGDEATISLRRDGSPELEAEVILARWGLEGVRPGDVLALDPDAGTVTRLDRGTWTQQELDVTWQRALEQAARFRKPAQ